MRLVNVLRHVALLAAIVSCVLALPKISSIEESERLLHRQKRATPQQVFSANKPDKWKGCPKGRYFTNATKDGEFGCVKCPRHTFSHKLNLWKNCVACPAGEGTPGDAAMKCFAHCTPGYGWDKNRGKIFSDGTREGKCYICPYGSYNNGSNVDECRGCAKYHSTSSQGSTGPEACGLACPKGFEPDTGPDGTLTCSPCPFGSYQKHLGQIGNNPACVSCPSSKNWTLSNGAHKYGMCFKPWNGFKPEFVAMMRALKDAAPYVRDDVNKSRKLLDALCRSGADLGKLKGNYTKLMKKEMTIANKLENPVPQLRINAEETLTYSEVFTAEHIPSCEESGDTGPGGWTGSGSGWSGSGSMGWSGSSSNACTCGTGWSGSGSGGWSGSGSWYSGTGWYSGSGSGSGSSYSGTGWNTGSGWSGSGSWYSGSGWNTGSGWSGSGSWYSGSGWNTGSGWSSSGSWSSGTGSGSGCVYTGTGSCKVYTGSGSYTGTGTWYSGTGSWYTGTGSWYSGSGTYSGSWYSGSQSGSWYSGSGSGSWYSGSGMI